MHDQSDTQVAEALRAAARDQWGDAADEHLAELEVAVQNARVILRTEPVRVTQ